jgi:hypothetical protein
MSGDEPGFVVAPGELDERGSQPLTTPYSLGPSKQKTTRDGSPASSGVVSGGGFNDDPWARHHAPVWLTKR